MRSPSAASSAAIVRVGGRLALRPDDVDRVERALRVAEPLEQRLHPLEPEAVLGQGEARPPSRVGRQTPHRARVRPGCDDRSTACQQGKCDSRHVGSPSMTGLAYRPRQRRRARRARGGSARASRARRATTSAGAFWTKRSLASIFSARAISWRSRARSASASPRRPLRGALGLHDRLEDPRLVALERRHDAGAAEHLRRLLHARRALRPRPRRRPRATAPRSAACGAPGRFDQISSVTCGITGCSSVSSRSSAAVAVARAPASPS